MGQCKAAIPRKRKQAQLRHRLARRSASGWRRHNVTGSWRAVTTDSAAGVASCGRMVHHSGIRHTWRVLKPHTARLDRAPRCALRLGGLRRRLLPLLGSDCKRRHSQTYTPRVTGRQKTCVPLGGKAVPGDWLGAKCRAKMQGRRLTVSRSHTPQMSRRSGGPRACSRRA